jgi:hypothetical protein
MADDLQSKATEIVKKVLTVGIGAVFLTEESLRGLVSEFKLPKELLGGILESANKTKEEFMRSLSKEMMSQIMDRIDCSALMQELISQNEIELQVKINFKPKK